jgi:hypothetical protein
MRYLKLYEEWEPKDSVKEDIKDIFIELTDNYLDVHIDDFGKIFITKPLKMPNELSTHPRFAFKLTDYNFDIDSNIIDSILRFIDYLKQNKLYLNEIIIRRLRRKTINGVARRVTDDLYVSNITEEGLFIREFNDKVGKYESELFLEPVHQIIIKYSNKNL